MSDDGAVREKRMIVATLSLASKSAPASMRSFTTRERPWYAAFLSAVAPAYRAHHM